MISLARYIGIDWREPRPPADPGFTCWSGCVVGPYRDLLGKELSPWSTIPPGDRRAVAAAVAEERAAWIEVPTGRERPFDVVLFRHRHVGLVVEKGRMLHVDQITPSCIESYRTGAWEPLIVGFYRPAF